MNRILGKLSRRDSSSPATSAPATRETTPEHAEDSPEATLLHELKTFCESHPGPENAQGEEFVHLPRIVEIAESSPSAAKEAAYRIRKYLSSPSNTSNHAQYNAIMVMRILVDNPGHTFTRNIDTKFVAVIKDLLRYGRDWHVQHYLRQYLNSLEGTKHDDIDLQPLLQMWAKEKSKGERSFTSRFPQAAAMHMNQSAPYPPPHPSGYFQAPQVPVSTLPDPGELAARVEEARNSANLLKQFVQSTPVTEMEENELIKEFIDRCRTSSRLIQSYIHSTNPAPDEATLLTLIDCNDEISVALSQQQRAMLRARQAKGTPSPLASAGNGSGPVSPAGEVVASGARSGTLIDVDGPAMTGGRTTNVREDALGQYEYHAADFEVQNPFADNFASQDSGAEQHSAQGGRTVYFQSTEHA
ncbi:hypothetical protein N7488_005379 [Penicillium malachiteum]|nr:hypothetical protein N7488_005379 [Penicillium malachiteum]